MTSQTTRRRIGILGAGTIARKIVETARLSDSVEVAYVLVRDGNKTREGFEGIPVLTSAQDALAVEVDLVVEAANADIVKALAPEVLRQTHFCAFSLTALSDKTFLQTVDLVCAKYGHNFYAPHGAVLGLDGLADGREVLDSVTVTTTKSAKSFGLAEDAEGLVFEGTAREACIRFPRNVNVHAAVAVAGLGFDRTKSRIIVAPKSPRMAHHIEAKGEGLEWSLEVASQSLGGVTGSYTPVSAAQTVMRLVGGMAGVTIA